MPLSHIVNNIGVGKVEASMLNLSTTVAAGSATPFSQAKVDAYERACSLFGNNYVGHGTTTFNLFGAVLAVSENNQAGKAFPEKLVVQVSGFADIQGTTGDAAPVVNANRVVQQRAGFVAPESTPSATNALGKGTITNVYDTDRCVVLL